ncbi:MAG: T9SS type A sorting domain-containing protein [Saprospiraceae bacterium]|nr:T9SS type A sorting domain-containing protein [Saprospiraceae bacterium]
MRKSIYIFLLLFYDVAISQFPEKPVEFLEHLHYFEEHREITMKDNTTDLTIMDKGAVAPKSSTSIVDLYLLRNGYILKFEKMISNSQDQSYFNNIAYIVTDENKVTTYNAQKKLINEVSLKSIDPGYTPQKARTLLKPRIEFNDETIDHVKKEGLEIQSLSNNVWKIYNSDLIIYYNLQAQSIITQEVESGKITSTHFNKYIEIIENEFFDGVDQISIPLTVRSGEVLNNYKVNNRSEFTFIRNSPLKGRSNVKYNSSSKKDEKGFIYPNIAFNEIRIQNYGLHKFEFYSITSIDSKMSKINQKIKSEVIDVSDLMPGVYIIRLYNKQGIKKEKFIKI